MEATNNSDISNNDIYINGSDDEEEWQKEINELKAFRAGLEQAPRDDWDLNDPYESFNVLNVILSCSEYSSSAEKVLIMNRAMIYMLKQMKSQVIANLRANADKQAALFEELKSINQKFKNSPTASFVKCGMPYFKLKNGWAQPPNVYCEQHKKLGYASPEVFIKNSYCWSDKDSKNLKNLVIDYVRETNLVELENKVRLMSRFGSSKKSFEEASKQVKKFQRKDGKEIDSENVDWLRISCNLANNFTPYECQKQWECFVDPKINNSNWTAEEKQAFFPLVKEHGFQSWDKIAKLHGYGRTGLQCCIKFHRSIIDRPYQCSRVDNEKFVALYNYYKTKKRPLLKIAYFMDCTINECKARVRYLKINESTQYHNPLKAVKKDLKVSFQHVPKSKQRSLAVKHAELNNESNFTSEEDHLLLEAVVNHGKKWDIVYEAVPGRNQTEVKNRYEKLIKFSKIVMKAIDNDASDKKLDLLPTLSQGDTGFNVWSILQLFWEPPDSKVSQVLLGLPLGNGMSASTQQLLRILEFGHNNIFGPRFSVPRTNERKEKMVKTMAVISQTLDVSFHPIEIIENLQKYNQNTPPRNQTSCAENIILHLEDCLVPDLSPAITRSFIPPNLLTLVGARVLCSVRGLLNSQADLPIQFAMTTINPTVPHQNRLLPLEAKELLKKRIFSMFFLSLCVGNAARYPGHYDKTTKAPVAPRVKTKKKKLTTLKRKRHLQKLALKRWNKTVEEPATKTKDLKRPKTSPLSNETKKPKMIRVTKVGSKSVSVEIDSSQ